MSSLLITNGTLDINADGLFSYIPTDGFLETDTFLNRGQR
ncbi:MAG: Ig-like domain-containing protein [Chloroflexota bacterium]|nr:Ig-like domain-containing protein [Chloroflexota bacterium]